MRDHSPTSAWVPPSMAAELWGLPVESVLASMREGRLASKTENGFEFVQIDTDAAWRGRPHSAHPPTFAPLHSIITEDERAALAGHLDVEESVEQSIDDWRAARERTSKLRRAPRRTQAA